MATAATEVRTPNALKSDGSVALTANWDAGGFEIRSNTFQSDVATGTAPFTVASTTAVTNLNADQVDGQHRVLTINADHTHATTGAQGGQLDHGLSMVAASLLDDDHTQYRLESADHTHQSTGVEAGKLDHGLALDGLGDDDHTIYLKKTSMSFTVPPTYGTGTLGATAGIFPGYYLDTAAKYCNFTFGIPANFSSLTSAKIYLLEMEAGGTPTFGWTANTRWGADGENWNTNSDSATGAGNVLVNNQMESVDISAAFTGVAIGDAVGVQFYLDAIAGTTPAIRVFFLEFIYTAV